ncbi:hypothetical protein FM110_12990 [Brachybacterium nesterenkovii]|uniref:Uncharacterized protein n=1 Tax=Brachybacterium nesterenkovii TaxID=47847 RepID=A0A1X6X8Z8_9MICO|nr:hypothetical protein FM110_12990 [Brachybacterium nesterenkovii]
MESLPCLWCRPGPVPATDETRRHVLVTRRRTPHGAGTNMPAGGEPPDGRLVPPQGIGHRLSLPAGECQIIISTRGRRVLTLRGARCTPSANTPGGTAQGLPHAQDAEAGAGHRAQGTGHRAQGTGHGSTGHGTQDTDGRRARPPRARTTARAGCRAGRRR